MESERSPGNGQDGRGARVWHNHSRQQLRIQFAAVHRNFQTVYTEIGSNKLNGAEQKTAEKNKKWTLLRNHREQITGRV